MLLENEGEILSMTVMETYSGQSPIVIDNDDKVISLDISALSAQLSGFNTFSGVITDTTLTGDGYNTPLGVNDIQSLSSDESISITVTGNNVMLGVASGWFNGAVNSAYSGMTAYATTGDLYNTSSTLSGAIDYVSANAGFTYEGIAPIVVNNTTQQISANTWQLSAGTNITLVDDDVNHITRLDVAEGYTPNFHYIEI